MTSDSHASHQQPASRRVADLLRAAIERGQYGPGDRLPSYRDLVNEHGIAMGTAREVMRLLERDGMVEVRHGSGAFVCKPSDLPPGDPRRVVRAEMAEVTAIRNKIQRLTAGLDDVEQRLADLANRIGSGDV